jgi:hypothetical protein
MIAKARIGITLVLAMGLAACDLSQQKKPEVIDTAVVTKRVGDTAAAAPGAVGSGTEAAGAGEERSIRLFGPGVSRERQIRI